MFPKGRKGESKRDPSMITNGPPTRGKESWIEARWSCSKTVVTLVNRFDIHVANFELRLNINDDDFWHYRVQSAYDLIIANKKKRERETKGLFIRDEFECDRKKIQGVPVPGWFWMYDLFPSWLQKLDGFTSHFRFNRMRHAFDYFAIFIPWDLLHLANFHGLDSMAVIKIK